MLPVLSVLGLALGASASIADAYHPRELSPAIVGNVIELLSGRGLALAPRQAAAAATACADAAEFISICSSLTPGFLNLPTSRQATCLCYSSAIWVPNIFDGYVDTCASFARTADPSDYGAFSGLQDFCTIAGNVRAVSTSAVLTSASTTAKPTTASAVVSTSAAVLSPSITAKPTSAASLIANAGCSTVFNILGSCSSATQGFTNLPPTGQASCICYTSSTYAPGNFDNQVATCANFASTADPTDYSIVSPLQSFCTNIGDVVGDSGSKTAVTTGSAGITNSVGNVVPVVTKTATPTPPVAGNGAVTITELGILPTMTPKAGAASSIQGCIRVVFVIASLTLSAIIFL